MPEENSRRLYGEFWRYGFTFFLIGTVVFGCVANERESGAVELRSDGKHSGKTAYELIREAFGEKSLEVPDAYPGNHPDLPHIYEAQDGNYFVFTLHRDVDKDRDTDEIRQRNEIKIYAGSRESLKAWRGYRQDLSWRFRLVGDFQDARTFTHFFQLKAVGGDHRKPLFTISAAQGNLELRHSPSTEKGRSILAAHPLKNVLGRWLEVNCSAVFEEAESGGHIQISVRDVITGNTVLAYSGTLDLWRGIGRGLDARDFVRPKWGIYRSLKDRAALKPGEERVDFADFSVRVYRR